MTWDIQNPKVTSTESRPQDDDSEMEAPRPPYDGHSYSEVQCPSCGAIAFRVGIKRIPDPPVRCNFCNRALTSDPVALREYEAEQQANAPTDTRRRRRR